jgi:hypothetical protein
MGSGETRQPSRRLSFDDAVEIHRRLRRGEFVNRIAAHFDVNPGRVSEIRHGILHPGSREAATSDVRERPKLI